MDPAKLKTVKKTIFWQEMNIVASACIARAEKAGISLTALAHKADLSPTTVYGLHYQTTGYPQWMSIWKLCLSVGCKLEVRDRSSIANKKAAESLPELRKAFGRKPAHKFKTRKKKGKKSY